MRLLVVFLWATSALARGPVTGVASVGMTVSDLDRAVAFYTDVLAFERSGEPVEVTGDGYEHLEGLFGLRMRVARLRLGDETLELTEYLAPGGRPIPADSRSNDGWFQHVAIIVSDMDRAYETLRAHRVTHASSGPQRLPDWNPNAGGIRAFYFKDPDGHVLEVLAFPPGKGLAKWHRDGGRLFLGIDHTAIVVRDTAASRRFYHDALGLDVAGESENHGTEQEHLNNVFGARLHITTLRGSEGPGVELLEYLAPRDGRPMPADARASDLWYWQTAFRVADARTLSDVHDLTLVSPGAVRLPGGELGFADALTARDPDGHAIQLRVLP